LARAWRGMQENAITLMEKCKTEGIDVCRYGADLPAMAEVEQQKNVWAVRFLYLHILNRGLCLRPPWSMVEHIGFDADATNASNESWVKNPPLKPSPPKPTQWPVPVENAECARLHRKMCGVRPTIPGRLYGFARRMTSKVLHRVSPR